MDGNAGYVIAGYVLTVVSLGGFVLRLHVRARAARVRAEAMARRRRPA